MGDNEYPLPHSALGKLLVLIARLDLLATIETAAHNRAERQKNKW